MARVWTDTERRNDWPTRRRAEGRTDASGPDMWPDEEPTSREAPEK